MNTSEFVALIKRLAREVVDERRMEVRLGTVDPAYASDRPKITFDGESTISGKQYPHLSFYAPTAGDRVLLLRAGRTWVVIGKVL